MREYDRIKQFCKEHETELEACYKELEACYKKEHKEEDYKSYVRIFELEERLREAFNFKTNPFGKDPVIEGQISGVDFIKIYEFFQEKSDCLKKLAEDYTSFRKEEFEGFSFKLSEGLLGEARKAHRKGNEYKPENKLKFENPEAYANACEKLNAYYSAHQSKVDELMDKKEMKLSKGTLRENVVIDFYRQYETDLRDLSNAYKSENFLQLREKIADDCQCLKGLQEAYREETEKANEEKFSCIRRSVMPACYFPILYQHFFVKNASEYSNIEDVNKFLYRALKLQDDDVFCVFVPETMSIGLKKEVKEQKNYHVNQQGQFSDFKEDRYSSLLHELLHFMNALESFDCFTESANIKVRWGLEDVIKTDIFSKMSFSKEDIYRQEEKNKGSDKELDEEYVREELNSALGNAYDTGAETWTMYGILICEDEKNPGEYEFYYDPINEAVADAECKIINGDKKRVVRTGHFQLDESAENRVYQDDETSRLVLEVLSKKTDVYKFYFKESLRELIHQ